MKVYVETNFVLELAFQQEECSSCENILNLCETEKIQLMIPAYSLVEPYDTLIRKEKRRKKLQQELNIEFEQLKRSIVYRQQMENLESIDQLLTQSNEEDRNRFENYKANLLNIAEIIPLTTEILKPTYDYSNQ